MPIRPETLNNLFDVFYSQINIGNVEDLESFYEQIMGVPLLLRVWAEFVRNDYIGAPQPEAHFEGTCSLNSSR